MRGINLHPSVKIKAASECYFKCCLYLIITSSYK